MNYGEIITRALGITWRYKFLWLLAIFAGESTAFGLPDFSRSNVAHNGTSFRFGSLSWQSFTTWISDHTVVIWAAAAVVVILAIVLLLVSAAANGALVRASADADADRPLGLRAAWSAGVGSFWPVLALKLFTFAVFAVLAAVIGGLILLTVTAVNAHVPALAVGSGLSAGILFLLAIPFWVVYQVAALLGVRAIVLDGKRPFEGLGGGFQMVRRRFGRVALVWLLVGIAGLVANAVVSLIALVVAIPLVAVIAAAYFAGGGPLAVGVGIVLALAWVVVLAALSGGVSAFTSTCWTLAYRRFDQEPQPVPAGTPVPA